MAGKSNRGKNRGRASNAVTNLSESANSVDSSAASKDNSKVVESVEAGASGVQQSNLGDKPSGVDESNSAKSEVAEPTSSNQPKPAEVTGDLHLYPVSVKAQSGEKLELQIPSLEHK